jgi:hypothetical protein
MAEGGEGAPTEAGRRTDSPLLGAARSIRARRAFAAARSRDPVARMAGAVRVRSEIVWCRWREPKSSQACPK